MKSSAPNVTLDSNGVCNHCSEFEKNIRLDWLQSKQSSIAIEELVQRIKKWGASKKYDCILGLSGGLDSSYLLHLAVAEFGLRPLVFHVDGGWNSELAVHNIQALISKLDIDFYTDVINWHEMRDLQLAFFKSGVPHIDIPQDHAFIATLYNYAQRHDIKFILNGGNISTEVVQYPLEYYYWGTDMRHLNDIIRRYCSNPLRTYPFSSVFRHRLFLRYLKGVEVVKPLNLVDFNKLEAQRILEETYGWRKYPQKHFESRFTRFFEGYWLPRRFGYDVRRVQFSSLILTQQMERSEALECLNDSPLSQAEIESEFEYVSKKLNITEDELTGYLEMPKKYYWDYKNLNSLISLGSRVSNMLGQGRSGVS